MQLVVDAGVQWGCFSAGPLCQSSRVSFTIAMLGASLITVWPSGRLPHPRRLASPLQSEAWYVRQGVIVEGLALMVKNPKPYDYAAAVRS